MEPDDARAVLTEERDRLDEVARRAHERAPQPTAPDDVALDRDPGDQGADTEAHFEDQGLVDEAARRRTAIDAALARLDDGTWGTCAVCGRAIDGERLDALPETDRCRDHARSTART